LPTGVTRADCIEFLSKPYFVEYFAYGLSSVKEAPTSELGMRIIDNMEWRMLIASRGRASSTPAISEAHDPGVVGEDGSAFDVSPTTVTLRRQAAPT